jgi:hypothetical protein
MFTINQELEFQESEFFIKNLLYTAIPFLKCYYCLKKKDKK